MNKIISQVHNAIQNSRKSIEFLNDLGSWIWVQEYPVAVLHEITRVKEQQSLNTLNELNFFDSEGFSKNSYTDEEIEYLKQRAPDALKTVGCLCLREKQNSLYTFSQKFEHDKWKKVQDEGNFELFMEFSKFTQNESSKEMETHIRDILRSAKEIPSLKAIGFIWIVTLAKNSPIEDILKHYFLDNFIYVSKGRKVTYIAWSDRLANINMRHFVNTP